MSAKTLRILFEIAWLNEEQTVSRIWDGAGPYVDADGEIWGGAGSLSGLDGIEQAFNGEASTLNASLSGVPSELTDRVWASLTHNEIVGSRVRIQIQHCDLADQPVGAPEIRFTGTIDNIIFDDRASDEDVLSTITVEIANNFSLRRLRSGSVLSDVDQRARAVVLNPSAALDRFCERMPMMLDKVIVWPRWN